MSSATTRSIEEQTLQTSIQAIDDQLEEFDTSLAEVDWKVVNETENEVSLSFTAPDGTLEISKRYQLNAGDVANPDESVNGYLVDFDLTVKNLSERPQDVSYTLLGPVGLPLEDKDNSRTYVEVKTGTLDDDSDASDVSDIAVTATEVVKQIDKAQRMNDPGQIEVWRAPIKYIGADVQYFAALLFPQGNQIQEPYFEKAEPVVVRRDNEEQYWSDVSVQLTSRELTIPAQESVQHSYQFFFGPKRSELMEPLGPAV